MRRHVREETFELSIGPHSARVGWLVLRVTYPGDRQHRERVACALDALLAEAPPADAGPHDDRDLARGATGEG